MSSPSLGHGLIIDPPGRTFIINDRIYHPKVVEIRKVVESEKFILRSEAQVSLSLNPPMGATTAIHPGNYFENEIFNSSTNYV